jgi:hypothetical protein
MHFDGSTPGPKTAPINCPISGIGVDSITQSNADAATRLLTRKGLADRWQLSTETLKRRERCGLLPFLKLGRGVRYRVTDIERIEADAEVR